MFTARKSILLLSVALVACLGLRVQASSAIEQAPDNSALRRRVTEIDDIATTDHLDGGDHDDLDHADDGDHDDKDHLDDGDHDDEAHEDHAEHDEASEQRDQKPSSEVLFASLLINLVTLSGLVVLSVEFLCKIFCKSSRKESSESRWMFTLPSLCCNRQKKRGFYYVEVAHNRNSLAGLLPLDRNSRKKQTPFANLVARIKHRFFANLVARI
jgi:hypothetical protein